MCCSAGPIKPVHQYTELWLQTVPESTGLPPLLQSACSLWALFLVQTEGKQFLLHVLLAVWYAIDCGVGAAVL